MLEMLLSAWTMNKADFVGWVLEPTQEVVALSTSASAWLTSDPPYLATKRNPVKPNIDPACFVAGTLVHTKEGLRPIEEIKVGDWVLSKPENGEGEQAYKRVTQTFVHEDREVFVLFYIKPGSIDCKESVDHLIVTANHPFFVKGYGWKHASELEFGELLELSDETTGAFWKNEIIRQTEINNLGWVLFDDIDQMRPIDFRVYPYIYGEESDLDDHELIYDAWMLRQVFNIEVEDYHTYYVGAIGPNNAGVLVHNKNNADIAAVQEVAKNGLFVTGGVPVYESSPRRLG